MNKLDKYMDEMKDELHSAKEYAECYVYYKQIKPEWAKKYHEMAINELTHAQYLKEIGMSEYEQISKSYMPESMKNKWEHYVKKYADKVACVKSMLTI